MSTSGRMHVSEPDGDAPYRLPRAIDGLSALVRETLGADPFSGTICVFGSKRADRAKLVFWDGTGVGWWPGVWRRERSAGPD